MERQVAIIGAGISGLLACRYCLSKGFRPVVFESRSATGGVWTKTVSITKLQSSKSMYQFSDFPWPESVKEEFPTQDQVLDYIQSYATHFDLLRHVKFNTKVMSISFDGVSGEEMETWSHWGGTGEPFGSMGKWNVTVKNLENLEIQVYQVDFVILCVGKFSDVPYIPEFPADQGPEVFQGTVIHSMDYADMDYAAAEEFIKGKTVTVVGLQKSAMDIAVECSMANGVEKPCTLIYRTKYWNLPDHLPWGVPLGYLYLNRFSELLLHKPGEGFLLSLVATLLSPLRWLFSKFVETHINQKLCLSKFGMVPEHDFLQNISSCLISTVPKDFYNRVEEGSIKLKKAPSFGFCRQGLVIEGETLETDMVIFGTGFNGIQKLKDIFVSPSFKQAIAGSPNSTVPLYRECIHPRIPQLAIIGFSESVSNLFTSEMRCRWVAELLDGTFKVPSIKEMEEDIEEWDKHLKRYSGKYYRRSCLVALSIWYNDLLCKDMGWNPRRKKGFLADLFKPYGPLDYVNP